MTISRKRAILCVFLGLQWGVLSFVLPRAAHARDDGRYEASDPALHAWFDQLASGKGLCCSFVDGSKVEDVDWDTQRDADGSVHYRVRLNGEWIVVPDAAVVKEPNRFGPAMVWPCKDAAGATQIRCFIPGAGS
ncbi:MAG: hypothetical protein WB760_20150 [Xanthobacteraceae bacterium]